MKKSALTFAETEATPSIAERLTIKCIRRRKQKLAVIKRREIRNE